MAVRFNQPREILASLIDGVTPIETNCRHFFEVQDVWYTEYGVVSDTIC